MIIIIIIIILASSLGEEATSLPARPAHRFASGKRTCRRSATAGVR